MEGWKLNKAKDIGLRKFAFLVVAQFILSSCVNYLQEADTAYQREDWDAAVQYYTYALNASKEAVEIERIKGNLAAAKQQGALNHLEKADQLERFGEIDSAYQHAVQAYKYQPSSQAESVLNRLKTKEVDRLVSLGQASLDTSRWESAISYLHQANAIQNSERVISLLAMANVGRAKEASDKFSSMSNLARDALENRSWALAVQHYKTAHQFESTTSTNHELEFASLMADAEDRLAGHRSVYSTDQAEAALVKALEYQIDSQYVRDRIEETKLRDYKITIHSAVILPFDPADNTRWDGISNDHIDAVSEIAKMVTFGDPISSVYANISSAAAKITLTSSSAPDPILFVSTEGNHYGGDGTLVENAYRPQWEYSLTYSNINKHDQRVLSISVFDHDLVEHDKVGDYQFVLGELVASPGVIEKVFISENQKLLAGGLAGLKLSVEEM